MYVLFLVIGVILLDLSTCSSPPAEKMMSSFYPSFYLKVVDQDVVAVEGIATI